MHRILDHPAVAEYERVLGRETIKRAINAVFDRARFSLDEVTLPAIVELVIADLELRSLRGLRSAINATGILIHTNLGRAPLAQAALDAMSDLGAGYSNLEFDVDAGVRSSRYERVNDILGDLFDGRDALVVNNCAAAMMLVLDTFARGKDVIVSRGELIEIGGGFRLPDVLERSGARLVEVGSTNKTYITDVQAALTTQTALLLRSHTSNYRIEGFVHPLPGRELAALGHRVGIPVVEDLGSGAIVDLTEFGLPAERTIGDALHDGSDLVVFSGDKLLGGPQAGIILGNPSFIARMRSNPLLRALRVDKMTLAALDATLQLHRSAESRRAIPIYAMLATTCDALRLRADAYVKAISGVRCVDSRAFVGGGTLATNDFASVAIALPAAHGTDIARQLRRASRPIVARIESGTILLDLRTIAPADDAAVIATVRELIG